MGKVFKQKYFHREPFLEVYVKADIGELVVEPHDEDYIDLSGMVIGGTTRDINVSHEEEASSLRIYISPTNPAKIVDVKAKIRIPVAKNPKKFIAGLDTGNIRIDGLNVGTIVLESNNGDITTLGVKGGEGRLSSINGDIYVRGGEFNSLNITSTNGDIRLELSMARGKAIIENINGEIRLLISEDSDTFIEASSINGVIYLHDDEGKLNIKSMDKRFLQGVLGEGRSEAILKTINGPIRIEVLRKITKRE